MGQGGGVCFSDGGDFIFKWGDAPWVGFGFDRGFSKKIIGWGGGPPSHPPPTPILLHPTMGNSAPYSIKKPDRLPLHLCYVININNMII